MMITYVLIVLVFYQGILEINSTGLVTFKEYWQLSLSESTSINTLDYHCVYILDNQNTKQKEIYVVGESSEKQNLLITKLNADGVILWHRCVDFDAVPPYQMSIYDINADGILDPIIFSGYASNYIMINGKTGRIIFDNSQLNQMFLYKVAEEAINIDGDEVPEIILADDIGNVLCINSEKGKKLWELNVFSFLELEYAGVSDYRFPAIEPILYDINNDSKYEVFVCFGFGFPYVFCIDAMTGKILWRYKEHNNNLKFMSSPVIADCNQDGNLEVILATGGRGTYADSVYLYAFDAVSGKTIWKSKYIGDSPWHPIVSQFKFNDISILAVASQEETKISFVEGKKGLVIDEFNQSFFVKDILFHDINQDSTIDLVVVFSKDNFMYLFSVVSSDANNITQRVNTFNNIPSDSQWNWMYHASPPKLESMACYFMEGDFVETYLNDLDNDGIPELIILSTFFTQEKKLAVFKLNSLKR